MRLRPSAGGVSSDGRLVSDFYENVRAFRIFDGADEVHLRTIARNAFEDVNDEELTNVTHI